MELLINHFPACLDVMSAWSILVWEVNFVLSPLYQEVNISGLNIYIHIYKPCVSGCIQTFKVVNVLLSSSVTVAVAVYLPAKGKENLFLWYIPESNRPSSFFSPRIICLAETGEGEANGFVGRKAEKDQKPIHIGTRMTVWMSVNVICC